MLERQLASLRKDLIQKSKSMEAAVSVGREELLKEKARSQELEKSMQGLSLELSQGSASTVAQTKLQELEQHLFAQSKEIDELRKSLEGEKDDRGNERTEADHRLAKVQEEKQQLDTQYKTLLGRVAHIKTTLGDKLKSDAVSIFGFMGDVIFQSIINTKADFPRLTGGTRSHPEHGGQLGGGKSIFQPNNHGAPSRARKGQ